MPARNCSRSKRDQSTPIASPTRLASSLVVRRCSVMSSSFSTSRLASPRTDRAPKRGSEENRHGGGHEPPDVRALGCKQRRQPERDRDPGGDSPVVAHDEVPPEAAEGADVSHAWPAEG